MCVGAGAGRPGGEARLVQVCLERQDGMGVGASGI